MPIKLSSIKPNPTNPRLIKDARFKKLCQSIEEFPQMMELRPMIIDKTRVIIGGNMRYKACQHLGMKEVPDAWVKKAQDLTEDERSRFIIADNVSFGENDWDALANGFDLPTLEGWGMEVPDFALDKKDEKAEEDGLEIPDEVTTDIQPGDIFEIGNHRLLCGDSTLKADVDKLLNGAIPVLMVTDPPYGVNYDPDWRNRADRANGQPDGARAIGLVSNDNRVDWTEAYYHFPGQVLYIWHGGRHAKEVAINIEKANFIIICQIVWAKNGMVISRGDYHWQHEPCWYAVRKGKKHNWQGDRSQTTVWNIDRPKKSETGHSTQKPIECMARPIRNNTKDGDAIYDPFIGSGTSMVAAYQLNRVCYGIEIEPKYCQIIIDRMIHLDSNILIKRNGLEYKRL